MAKRNLVKFDFTRGGSNPVRVLAKIILSTQEIDPTGASAAEVMSMSCPFVFRVWAIDGIILQRHSQNS